VYVSERSLLFAQKRVGPAAALRQAPDVHCLSTCAQALFPEANRADVRNGSNAILAVRLTIKRPQYAECQLFGGLPSSASGAKPTCRNLTGRRAALER
jgi:hypothetical protein